MDDPETDIEAANDQPRKKQKIELESDNLAPLGRSEHDRKLTLLHAPDSTFAAFEDHFSPIKLKQITKGGKYGKWLAVEVSFWTEDDLLRARAEFNHKLLGRHYVTLKLPQEALEEMEETKSGWHFLPYYLVDNILELLTVFREGKLLKRVRRIWKESIQKAERAYPFVVLRTIPKRLSLRMPEPCPEKTEEDIKHLVVCPPIDYLPRLREIFSNNIHLERLTLFAWYPSLMTVDIHTVAPVPELVIMDSFLEFAVRIGDWRDWRLSLYVPLIKFYNLVPPGAVDEYALDPHGTEVFSKVFNFLDKADLWWPYPSEQTEWLKISLGLLGEEQLDDIVKYMSSTAQIRSVTVHEDVVSASRLAGWKGIQMSGNELTKRDCAMIGGYIATLDPSPNIPPPPYQWKYTHFDSTDYDEPYEGFVKTLGKVRRRARSHGFLRV